tara:strand:+ start:726 stop:875 length:150 start_codon:yes stop_codon:yes gene_type:complete
MESTDNDTSMKALGRYRSSFIDALDILARGIFQQMSVLSFLFSVSEVFG